MFTPDYIVDIILDSVGYTDDQIIDKKIMEPSFGEGIFLIHIIKRLLRECKRLGLSKEETAKQLENNIYGIELDSCCFNAAVAQINQLLSDEGYQEVQLHLYNQNALKWANFDFADYVIGNPPYVRIHEFNDDFKDIVSNFSFSKGMTDMYVLFFELGLKILNDQGRLGFITPNSYFVNKAQRNFRKYLLDNNLISSITDFGDSRIFDNIQTYTAITILNKDRKEADFTYSLVDKNGNGIYTSVYNADILNEKGEAWYFTKQEDVDFLQSVRSRKNAVKDYCNIQYGFETNRNDIYIGQIVDDDRDDVKIFNGYNVEAGILRKAAKSPEDYRGGDKWIIFPYEVKDNKTRLMPEDVLKQKYPFAYKYLLDHEDELDKRSMDKNASWYQFGRTQGLNNCYRKKLVVSRIINKDAERFDVEVLSEDEMVYTGIYITSDNDSNLDLIKDVLESEDFMRYAKLCCKNLSGGYGYISIDIIKNYRFD